MKKVLKHKLGDPEFGPGSFLITVCPRISDLTSLSHSFLMREMGMIILVLASKRRKDQV